MTAFPKQTLDRISLVASLINVILALAQQEWRVAIAWAVAALGWYVAGGYHDMYLETRDVLLQVRGQIRTLLVSRRTP